MHGLELMFASISSMLEMWRSNPDKPAFAKF